MNHDPIRSQTQTKHQPEWLDAAAVAAEQHKLAAEAMGWQALDPGVYLHQGGHEWVVDIVGQANISMQNHNVLWIVV